MEKKTSKIETRSLELRHDDNSKMVSGCAIVFNSPAVLYVDRWGNEYREQIDAHALDDCDLSDVPLKYNHSKDKAAILARVRDKSLKIEIRDDGLYFSAELRTNLGADVYSAVVSQDIKGCSFSFAVESDEWNEETRTRTIKKISRLTDISIVDNPAYPQTNVEARDYYKAIEAMKQKEKDERARLFVLASI